MAKRTRKTRVARPGKSARDKYLRAKYGITEAQYQKALIRQGGVCAICYRPPKPGKNFHTDHDHKPPRRVRGLLCFLCNKVLLGRGRENPEHHRRAAVYLESSFDIRDL